MSLGPHARAPFGGAYLARRPPVRSPETPVQGKKKKKERKKYNSLLVDDLLLFTEN